MTWYEKALGIAPDDVTTLLGLGASEFNLGAFDEAERLWLKVVDLEPDNAEAYYDLGFLALNQATPDFPAVERYWRKVIALDPGGELARTVQGHLDSLVAASMIPGSTSP